MSTITQGMASQYSDSSKLAARAQLARDFGSADVPWFTWVAKHLQLAAGSSVLDVGCGPAWFWPEAATVLPSDLSLTLLDQSQDMVNEAMERCRALPFDIAGVAADAQSLPFPDACFDAVIAMHMLYHVEDQPKAISEFHRVLKPGGMVLTTTNGLNNMHELYRLTTVFGSAPTDPAASVFDFERAHALLTERFGNAALAVHPQTMRVTDPETVYLALTSYPPGETASIAQQEAFRQAIDQAFAQGGGSLDVTKEVGVIISRKRD